MSELDRWQMRFGVPDYVFGKEPPGVLCQRQKHAQAGRAIDFAELDIRERDEVIHEGAGHVGMSALIDLIARK